MKKLKIALIISLFINIILCSLIPFFITFDNKYKGFTFIIKNNEAIIESYDGEYDTINIPSKVKYHGKKYLVTELYNNDGIFDKIPNSITIPQTIKKIGIIFKTNVEYYNKSNSKLKINYLGSIKDWCNIIFYEQPFFNYIDSTKINEINYMPAICERELIID